MWLSTCGHVFAQERFYFGDGVLPLFESGIPLLLERLKQLPDQDKVGARPGATMQEHAPSLGGCGAGMGCQGDQMPNSLTARACIYGHGSSRVVHDTCHQELCLMPAVCSPAGNNSLS